MVWVWEPCHTLLVMRGLDPRILLGGAVKVPADAAAAAPPMDFCLRGNDVSGWWVTPDT